MTKTSMVAAALLTLTAASAPATKAFAARPAERMWEIGPIVRGENSSIGMPPGPRPLASGAVSLEFPVGGRGQIDAQIDAMTTAIRPLAGARQITMRYRIDAAPGTRFVAVEKHDEAATVSLYFQQRADNWGARGRYASYRWYVPGRAVVPLAPGIHTVTVRLDEVWTNVNGQPNTVVPQGFVGAIEDTARIGFAFGSTSLRSHGVYATGPARFTLLDFYIE